MSEKLIEDDYLGDGVYASYDGYQITLDLRAQEPTYPVTMIALEPSVMTALKRYEKRCTAALERHLDENNQNEESRNENKV